MEDPILWKLDLMSLPWYGNEVSDHGSLPPDFPVLSPRSLTFYKHFEGARKAGKRGSPDKERQSLREGQLSELLKPPSYAGYQSSAAHALTLTSFLGAGTTLHGLYRYGRPQGIWFSAVLVVNRVLILTDFGHIGHK